MRVTCFINLPKRKTPHRVERRALKNYFLEVGFAAPPSILRLMRALSFACAFKRRTLGVLRLSPRPMTILLEFNAVFTSELIETDFVDGTDSSGADFQRNELRQSYRPETLGLEVREKTVLSLDVRVRYAVADLYAFASEFTTTTHVYSSPSRLGLSSRGPRGADGLLEVPIAEVAMADISVAKLRSWR